jgi:hypothetical protein
MCYFSEFLSSLSKNLSLLEWSARSPWACGTPWLHPKPTSFGWGESSSICARHGRCSSNPLYSRLFANCFLGFWVFLKGNWAVAFFLFFFSFCVSEGIRGYQKCRRKFSQFQVMSSFLLFYYLPIYTYSKAVYQGKVDRHSRPK